MLKALAGDRAARLHCQQCTGGTRASIWFPTAANAASPDFTMPGSQPLGWRRVGFNWIWAVRDAVRKADFLQKGELPLLFINKACCPSRVYCWFLMPWNVSFPTLDIFYFAFSTWVWFGMAIHGSITVRLNSCNGGWGWRQVGGSACANMTPFCPWEDEPLPPQALTFHLAPRLLAVVWLIRAMY